MVPKSPFGRLGDREASIVLVLMVPDTYYRRDDEITDALNGGDVPEQSE